MVHSQTPVNQGRHYRYSFSVRHDPASNTPPMTAHACVETEPLVWKAEGETMSRKNKELEAAQRKLRSQLRKLESERERLAGRLASLEASLAGEQERAMHATQAAAMQVHASQWQSIHSTPGGTLRITALLCT